MTAITQKCSRTLDANPVRVATSLKSMITAWFKHQQLKTSVALERRQLAALSDCQLKDIGISREAAEAEASKSDIPSSRRL